MNRTVILVNPASGGASNAWDLFEPRVLESLGDASCEIEWTKKGEIRSQVESFLARGVDKIVLIGGDGTVSDVASSLFSTSGEWLGNQISIGIIPFGRGNDFFRTLAGKSMISEKNRLKLALGAIEKKMAREVDVVRVDFFDKNKKLLSRRALVNVSSFGYGGRVVQRAKDRVGILGRSFLGATGLAYLLQTITGLPEVSPTNVRITGDGQIVFEGPLFSGFFLNGRFNAGGVEWLKGCHIDDGFLDLIAFEWQSREKFIVRLPQWLKELPFRWWKNVPGVTVGSARKWDIELSDIASEMPTTSETGEKTSFIEVDGDPIENSAITSISMECVHRAMKVWSL